MSVSFACIGLTCCRCAWKPDGVGVRGQYFKRAVAEVALWHGIFLCDRKGNNDAYRFVAGCLPRYFLSVAAKR